MYLENDFIAAVTIDKQRLSQPGYMGKLKRQLINENVDTLSTATRPPEFLVISLNDKEKK